MIKASIIETNNVKVTTVAISPKNSPILPSKKKKVEKAIIVVSNAETTGGNTSIVPSIAALIGDFPIS